MRAGSSLIPVQINRKVLDADLIIGLGSIFPHSDAGFTGGAKIVQPGVCGTTTTAATHIAAALLDEIPLGDADTTHAGSAWRRSPARPVSTSSSMSSRTIAAASSKSWPATSWPLIGAARQSRCTGAPGVAIPEPADVVIVGSYPGDIDWWQAEKCLVAAYFAVKQGGVIVFAGPCYEGLVHNHPRLRDWLRLKYAEARVKASAIDPADAEADLIAADVAIVNARVREKATILMVTEGLSDTDVSLLGYRRMPDLQTAVDLALELVPRGQHRAVRR